MKKLGLIINPIAGMGGKVGLKGTDGQDTIARAREMGAKPEAGDKAVKALKVLTGEAENFELYTCAGDMGENAARACGLEPKVICEREESASVPATGPADTEEAVAVMLAAGVDLLLFAGGDGTARNIYNVLGEKSPLPVIGIPAGVKIHSAVFATSPRNAGELALLYLQEAELPLRKAEVMDIDEEAFRAGRLSARLYGYLSVPCAAALMQNLKIGGMPTEQAVLEGIAEQIIEDMNPETLYIVGPGSTIGPIMEKLGLRNTLLGVDLILEGKLLAADVAEKDILSYLDGKLAKIIVTVIGGQGYIFGRGNQQISAEVIRKVGLENIIVAATRDKVLALDYGHLLVDTGDEDLNKMLEGYMKIITGYREQLIFPVKS